jgi:hypothetical protein
MFDMHDRRERTQDPRLYEVCMGQIETNRAKETVCLMEAEGIARRPRGLPYMTQSGTGRDAAPIREEAGHANAAPA